MDITDSVFNIIEWLGYDAFKTMQMTETEKQEPTQCE